MIRRLGFRRQGRSHPLFVIWAPQYTHRSSGVRALYRLCHHLNRAGYPSTVLVHHFHRGEPDEPVPSGWDAPLHEGPLDDSIVVYPEIVTGNVLGARRVVRWALNTPGLLGGETRYDDEEMVFVYDPNRLADVAPASSESLGPERVLWLGLVDPAFIYPDPAVPRTMDCSFTYKGRDLSRLFALPESDLGEIVALEDITPTFASLGDALRRTRVFYSYDHYSNALREAAVCGCEVRVVGADGVWHDPRSCDCALNIWWYPDLLGTYAARFHDSSFVERFVQELGTRWDVPRPDPRWRPRRRQR
jgi:hypothetical protein